MSDRINIQAGETGVVRVFSIRSGATLDLAGVSAALGGVTLDPEHVDLFTVSDLDALGLGGYLIDGMGVDPAEVAPLRTRLEALPGQVAILRSAAFKGAPSELEIRAPLRWVASFGEVPIDLSAPPLTSASATGVLTGGPSAPPPKLGKALAFVLFFLGLLVIATIFLVTRFAS